MDGEGAGTPRSVVVVRALPGLGDLLCLVPALRAMRAAWPGAHIALVGLAPEARGFVERFSAYLDGLIEFPGFPGVPERPFEAGRTAAFLVEMQGLRSDVALQLHGNGLSTNAFTLLLGARRTAGFYPPGLAAPGADFVPYPTDVAEPLRHLQALAPLGVGPAGEAALEWPVTDRDRVEFEAAGEVAGLAPGSLAVVHAGAQDPRRRWPAERFAVVADYLAGRGVMPVLTGTTAEGETVAAVSRGMRGAHLDACGRLTLGALGVLLTRARLVVTNDTGVSHLAAAVRAPSVVVFSASDRRRWAPLDSSLHRAVGAGVADIEPCASCPGESGRCLGDGCGLGARRAASYAEASEVVAAVEAALGG
ncbi:MAG: glycosyltransferase family 9 protein [Dehalococcoidia bacterium]